MKTAQGAILANETRLARYMFFAIHNQGAVVNCLHALAEQVDGEKTLLAIGESLTRALATDVPGLKTFPAQSGSAVDVPSTPAALCCWLRGDDRGELFHRSGQIADLLSPGFELMDVQDSFQYDANRDLSGYEDGTENPEGEEAVAAAIVQGQGAGMDGSSFLAIQQWLHDFDQLQAMSETERDDVIGRHIADNEEFDEAPDSAHVKRAAQESFEPEAFMLRRSMPWADGMDAGLMFVAFGKSFEAF
ncbi:MAG: Dyp-type peroxidase, partial [Gammaproteobacteria bacterium]|nr:Dyp-type peroxidase [Gammaproteobacteria bacterium]